MRRFATATASVAVKQTTTRKPVDIDNLTRLAKDVRALNAQEYQLFHSKLSSKFGFPSVAQLWTDLEEKASKIDVNAIAAAAAPVQEVAAAAAAAPAEPVAAAKASFDVKLESFAAGDKIKVIKVVRELLGLGLKETKEKVEGVPVVLKNDMIKDEADAWVEKLQAAGAKVVLE